MKTERNQSIQVGDRIFFWLGDEYGTHAGEQRAAFVCEVLNQQTGEVYAHALISPSDLACLPETNPRTRVPYVHLWYTGHKAKDGWCWPVS